MIVSDRIMVTSKSFLSHVRGELQVVNLKPRHLSSTKFWLYPNIIHSHLGLGQGASHHNIHMHKHENIIANGDRNIHCSNKYNYNDTSNRDENKNMPPLQIILQFTKYLHMLFLLILS